MSEQFKNEPVHERAMALLKEEEPKSDLCRIADSIGRIEGILQEICDNIDWCSSQVAEMNSNFDRIISTYGAHKIGAIRTIKADD